MLVSTQNLSNTAINPGWQAQTLACVSGGTTACGTIFPASSFTFQCGDHLTTPADPAECIIATVSPKFTTPWIGTWSIGLQQAITNSLTLDATYVGTHGGDLPRYVDINEAPLGSGYTAGQLTCTYVAGNDCGDPSAINATAEQEARPYYAKFPYMSFIDQLQSVDRSNYNSLQVTLTQRATHGLSFLAGYTYAHALDDASTYQYAPTPLNAANPGAIYASSDFDIRNRFTFTTTYDIPGRKSFAEMLEGWQVNSIITLNGSQPFSAKDTGDDFSGTGENGNLNTAGGDWVFVGNPSDFKGPNLPAGIPCWGGTPPATSSLTPLLGCSLNLTLGNTTPPAACITAANQVYSGAAAALAIGAINLYGCYVKGNSVLIPPALGTFNDGQRNIFRDSGYRNWDLSVTKTWTYKERYKAQFRAEVFNILNHPSFANPGGIGSGAGFNSATSGQKGDYGCGCVTPDEAAPNPVLGSGSNRAMELGLKLIF